MPIVGIHLATLFITALVIVHSDHQGFLYFRGKKQTLSQPFLKWSHHLVWAGLILMITTGVLLTIPQWEYRLTEAAFYVKMTFVGVLVVNAFAIGTLSKLAGTTPFALLQKEQRRTLLLSGALSSICWVGATVMGMFFI